jgi:hypothetical protein
VYQAMEEYKTNRQSIDSFSLNEMVIKLYGNTAESLLNAWYMERTGPHPIHQKAGFMMY